MESSPPTAFTLATPTRGKRAAYQYRHALDVLADAQRTPQSHHHPHYHGQQQQSSRRASFSTHALATPSHTPRRRGSFGALAAERRSSALRVDVRDITAIVSVAIKVDGFQFDSSIMEHPEFLISTHVVFQCQQLGGKQLETSWRLYRTFAEFQGLDLQLRRKFPFDMCDIAPPRRHRRRTFFRLHRSQAFLTKRCLELNEYLAQVLDAPTMRLTRFADPRAPLILRCFCNFDVGFGKKLRIRPEQPDSCVLCLDHIGLNAGGGGILDESTAAPPRPAPILTSHAPSHAPPPPMPSPPPLTPAAASDTVATPHAGDNNNQRTELQQLIPRTELEMLQRLRQRSASLLSASRSDAPSRADSKMDELEANLLDDRARNMAMCLRYDCSCQNMSFHLTEGKMARILRLRGFRQIYRPTDVDGPTALYCVLQRLQQHNDLDRKLFDLLGGGGALRGDASIATTATGTSDASSTSAERDEAQLAAGVELLREALANYALLYVHALEPHFRMGLVDLTKKLHEFKSRQQQRVGALELVLLCSMLDLTIVLVTNDHEGTVQEIFPLPGLEPVRRGGRVLVTLGYMLPTMVCVNGLYTLADRLHAEPTPTPLPPTMWQGLEEMDRGLVALIDKLVMQSELRRIERYDEPLAETLNRAILDAVWNDCQHNPNLFNLFQRQARQFGKSRSSAAQFFQYLEVAFGVEGATYLVDFLLYVLPEATLRKQLLRARWRRVQRHLTRRVAAVPC